MADKKKKGRRAYLSDYVLDVSGEYIYTGDYYIADTQGKDYKRICRGIFGLSVLVMAVLVGVGCLSTGTTSGAFYVTLPHVAAIILAAFCIYDSAVVYKANGKLRAHDYETSVPRMQGSSVAGAVCAFAAALGQSVYTIFIGSKATRGADILFLAGCFVAGMLYCLMFTTKKQILWQKSTEKAQKSIDK
jgi:hypothetical protein